MKPWIVFLCMYPLLLAYPMPSKEPSSPSGKESIPVLPPIRVEGVLRLVGSEPFTRLALLDAQHTIYYLEAGPNDPIRSYIGSPIKVEGLLVRKQVRLADNRELPDELSIVQYKWEPIKKDS
jgi:hypothetical protein